MPGWNYRDLDTGEFADIPEGDARKLVTLEKDEMIWIGIRAYSHAAKTWMVNGTDADEKVIAWQDLPDPARSNVFAMPKAAMEEFERAMREEVIPQIEDDIRRRAEAANETRHHLIFR
jgi:hypothetical protein